MILKLYVKKTTLKQSNNLKKGLVITNLTSITWQMSMSLTSITWQVSMSLRNIHFGVQYSLILQIYEKLNGLSFKLKLFVRVIITIN